MRHRGPELEGEQATGEDTGSFLDLTRTVDWSQPASEETMGALFRFAAVQSPVPAVVPEQLKSPPDRPTTCHESSQWQRAFSGTLKSERSVVDVSLVGLYDADVLEVRMNELHASVDYFAVLEMDTDHKGESKPLLWGKVLQHQERFQAFKDKVIHVAIEFRQEEAEMELQRASLLEMHVQTNSQRKHEHRGPEVNWLYERYQTWKGLKVLMERLEQEKHLQEATLIVGDADELIGRENAYALRFCELREQTRCTPVASQFVMSSPSCSFRSDWPPSYQVPHSISMPAVVNFRAGDKASEEAVMHAMHCWDKTEHYLAGGAHLSNYLYPPAIMLKEATATEYGGRGSLGLLATSLSHADGEERAAFAKDAASLKVPYLCGDLASRCTDPKLETELERETSRLPDFLMMNQRRFPAWFGNTDARVEGVAT